MDESRHPFRPAGALPAQPLAPYTGRWDARLAAHLLRRAGFGGSPADVARLAQGPLHAAVTSLVTFASTANLPPAPLDAAVSAAGAGEATPVMGAAMNLLDLAELRKQRRMQERRQIQALQVWWLDRMIATPAPLQEKMTLFWHGHFTTAAIQKLVTPAEIGVWGAVERKRHLSDDSRFTA
jgi:hypothetical protein